MAVSELDIYRTANLWRQLHGERALPTAREMVDAMRRKNEQAGTDTWHRIIVARGVLEADPAGPRH